jgi:hypothetical protein
MQDCPLLDEQPYRVSELRTPLVRTYTSFGAQKCRRGLSLLHSEEPPSLDRMRRPHIRDSVIEDRCECLELNLSA